ncbi:restriction endonuclease subunit S [Nostoc sp. FACHB-110]|uniref:restriction endonuclease subunit S n=1 Tax=Nostoc sp. FACHB-110 TaxID=2692834 RepID=UPI001684B10B|nr:restriction endonuclease subunit S [Nostoc sp. FACHB-110]MBD2436583.1 restriction endonuclease subunit S [Nostoc sp. FACHB-110]
MSLVVPFDEIFAQEIGLLAKHHTWERVEIKLVAEIINGFPFKSSLFSKDKGFPIIRIRDISCSKSETYYIGEYVEEYVVLSGDLLIGMDGNFICCEWKGERGLLNQRVCKVITNEKYLVKKFLLYGINGYLSAIQKATSSVTVAHLSSLDIVKIPFPLPPLKEQQRIVAKLEKLLAKVDTCKERLGKIPAILKHFRQSILAAACSGRLTADWREGNPDVESAEELLKNIRYERRNVWEENQLSRIKLKKKQPKVDNWKQNYQEPAFPKIEEIFFEIPESWCYSFIEILLSTTRKGMKTGPFGSLLKKHEHQTEGVPVLGIENIAAMEFIPGSKIHISKEKANELSEYDARPGDVLISRSGTVGEVCVVPEGLGEARISTNLMRISLAPNGLVPAFFCMLFNGSPFVLNQISELCKGSTRDFLNQEILSSIIFPIPPLSEQQEIVNRVQTLFKIADQIEQRYQKAKSYVDGLSQSIIAKAFRGELVPQDPNDEQASVLLERIKAEWAKQEGKTRVVKKSKSTGKITGSTKSKVKKQNLKIIQPKLPGF